MQEGCFEQQLKPELPWEKWLAFQLVADCMR